MRLTDRRTDRILIARPRLHSMQRGKKSVKQENISPRPTQVTAKDQDRYHIG